ncbi:dehydrogenase E1 component family protein, partial [Chlamydia psittaci 84-8471/1]
LCCVA